MHSAASHLGLTIALLALCGAVPRASADDTQFFKSAVEPVLRKNCLGCHNVRLKMSGLALDTRAGVLAGGKRGAAAIPGNPEGSELYRAISHSGEIRMPPTGPLPANDIAVLKRWIEAGLPWDGDAVSGPVPAHWAFRKPVRPPKPPADGDWARNTIDRFILARLHKAGLRPSPEADRTTLLRRVSLDLTGLPPSPKEVDAFLKDRRPDAYERVVDRLLASPHHGERWGRYWLDAAHYADSNGYAIDSPREIWKYRDWVIQALNADMPFDRFVTEQMAGDLLPTPTTDQLVATGFYRNTLLNEEGGSDPEQYRVEAVVDRVSTTGSALLGLTLACARCHDHKYDPVSQREFYQLYAFFNNIDEMTTGRSAGKIREPILEFGTPDEIARRHAFDSQLRSLETELVIYEAALPPNTDVERDPGSLERRKNILALRKQIPAAFSTLILRELPQPREAYIHIGGEFTDKGEAVTANTPAVLPPLDLKGTPNRLDLARWIVSRDHPLTARVAVNHLWQAYFGRGIVETQDDFGLKGSPPTHPELLDWLAVEFMDRNWSQKAMHRLIVTSATYRQASHNRSDVEEHDPRRISCWLVRTAFASMRRSCATLPCWRADFTTDASADPACFLPSRKARWRPRRSGGTGPPAPAQTDTAAACTRSSGAQRRTRRSRSNTPLQSLVLLNDAAFLEFAEGIGQSVLRSAPPNDAARVRHAFRLTLGRDPAPVEEKRLLAFLAARRAAGDDRSKAWTAAARVLMNLDEFRTRE